MSLFLIVALGVWVSSPINAVGQQRVQDPETHDGDVIPAGQGGAALQDGTGEQGSGDGIGLGIEGAAQRLSRVSERLNNPEIGEQIRVMTESHVQVQTKAKTALSNMQSRSKTLRFFFGASYKNAGEIKAQAAQLRADAEELASLRDSLTSVTDQEEVQGAMDSLEEEAVVLENELEQELEGFSLFGWLNRILSGY
jgi:hypothetical protein